MSVEKMSFSAALIWGRKRASTVFFLKALLQCSTSAESTMVTTDISSNHVLMVVSDSSPLSRARMLSHRSDSDFKGSSPFFYPVCFVSCAQSAKYPATLYQNRRRMSTYSKYKVLLKRRLLPIPSPTLGILC